MSTRLAALIRRWKVARRQRQYRKRDTRLGYPESDHRDALNRAQAERDVP